VANAFTKMVRDHHDTGFEAWLEAARAGELRSFADAIDRDPAAVRAALTEPWSTDPVERTSTASRRSSVKCMDERTTTCSGSGFLLLHDHVDCWTTPAENIGHCYRQSTSFTCASEMWKNPKRRHAFAEIRIKIVAP
jgi:hypothetical protein